MALDGTGLRSRRAILAGALGAAASVAVDAVARPAPALATSSVYLGVDNPESSTTSITNSSTGIDAFSAVATGTGSGVYGVSDSGPGVLGSSDSYRGVEGDSVSGAGVFGFSDSGDGVHGQSNSGNGVSGRSSSASASGIYGDATSSGGYGVAGRSIAGPLVNGAGASGVLGDNTADGIGVWARSAHGIALFADPVNQDAVALKAQGVTQFKRSGKLTVKAGTGKATKSGIRIDAGTLVLATLQQDRPGVYVRSAIPDAAGHSFTIHLNTTVSKDTTVAWFLVN